MEYKIRTAVPADEEKIRELFLEMLRTIYQTDDVKGYGAGAGVTAAGVFADIMRIANI